MPTTNITDINNLFATRESRNIYKKNIYKRNLSQTRPRKNEVYHSFPGLKSTIRDVCNIFEPKRTLSQKLTHIG